MKSDVGKTLFAALQKQVSACLKAIDALDFDRAGVAIDQFRAVVTQNQNDQAAADEETLNELAILRYLAEFLSDYANFWNRVVKKEYDASWNALQDSLDSIRLLKRLSSIDVSRFENQLVDLEKAYPYRVFASTGIIADRIECSICGKDMDSFECPHRAGQLYMGKMAFGIVHDIKQLDHVAITENPEDKRCVMKIQGKDYDYPAVDWLAANLTDHRFTVSAFSRVEISRRQKRNERFVNHGRNAPCFCGSGKKFKRCCIDKEYTTYPHAEFVLHGNPTLIDPA